MSQPRVLNADDPAFGEVQAYLVKHTASQGLNAVYERAGNELRIVAAHE